jgi:hypothetical protein
MARIRLLFQTIAFGVTINFINAYTVLDIVNNLSNHTNLAAAVAQDEQVVALLQNTSLKLTLFAPSDAAFAQLSDGMMTRLMSQPYEMHCKCEFWMPRIVVWRIQNGFLTFLTASPLECSVK